MIKPLSGVECMRAMGWDTTHWRYNPYDVFTDSQLRRLAGNAFSGHCFAAIIAAVVATQGMFMETCVLPVRLTLFSSHSAVAHLCAPPSLWEAKGRPGPAHEGRGMNGDGT